MTTNHSSEFEAPVVDQAESPQPPLVDEFAAISTSAPQPITVLDPDNPPWAQPTWVGALIAFLVWAGSVLCLLFVPLILVLPYIFYTAATGQIDLANLTNDKTFLFLSVLGVIPAHLLTFVIAYFVVTGGRRHSFLKTLGLSWPPSWSAPKGIVICTLVAIGLYAAGALITYIFPGQKTQLDILIESSYGARVVVAFLAVVTAPFVEEVIYRGMLYPGFARAASWLGSLIFTPPSSPTFGTVVSIGIVSIFFAAVHFLQYQNNLAVIGVITLVSITLTTVRALTRRLLPCLVIHLVFNGVQAVIFLLYPFLGNAPEPAPKPAPAAFLATLLNQLF